MPTDSPLALRPGVEIVDLGDSTLLLLRPGDAPDLQLTEVTPPARRLLELLAADGGRPEEIAEVLAREDLAVATDEIGETLAALTAHDLLTPSAHADSGLLDAPALERFDRQLHYFADVLPVADSRHRAQQRLAAAHVAVLGVGGLGTWAAAALAGAGIGRFTLIDGDHVELSNLHRQILYTEADLGRSKAVTCAERLRAIAPAARVDAVERRIGSAGELAGLLEGADVLVATADEPRDHISRWVDDACAELGIPHIAAGQFPPLIRVGPTVVPGRTARICCLYAQLEADPRHAAVLGRRAASQAAATLPTASAVIGGLLSHEILTLLAGPGDPATLGRAAILNLQDLSIRYEQLPERCARCASEAAG